MFLDQQQPQASAKVMQHIQQTLEEQPQWLTTVDSFNAPKASPPHYLRTENFLESHRQRLAWQLENPQAQEHLSYLPQKKLLATDESRKLFLFSATAMSLAIQDALKCQQNLTPLLYLLMCMVSVADDYLDQEDSYHDQGESLIFLSHAYLDLLDVWLSEESITTEVRRALYQKIQQLHTSLLESEKPHPPEKILFHKASGAAIVDLFQPFMKDSSQYEECRQWMQLLGEVGQLIDDVVDFEKDIEPEKPGNNYLFLKKISIVEALDYAEERLKKVTQFSAVAQLPSSRWLHGLFSELVSTLKVQATSQQPYDLETLLSCFSPQFLRQLQQVFQTTLPPAYVIP